MRDTIVITSSRMAGWLMFNRFHLLEVKRDLKDSTRNVFIFKMSDQLDKTMQKYNDYKFRTI